MRRYSETSIGVLRRIRAWILMRSFDSRSSDVYRAVHHFSDNAFFFADYSREFFEDVDNLLRKGKIKQVKRLLVYGNETEIRTPESHKIIRFHLTTIGYDCRVISSLAWENMLVQASLPTTLDLGIFGERRAYRAPRDKPDYVLGTWTGNRTEVRRLVRLFENSWQDGRRPEAEGFSKLSIDELFAS